MKTTKNRYIIPIIFLLIASAILCFSYFSENLYVAHDSFFHMYRIVGVKEALQDHQFLPKIYPYANNGYGYASPLFYCDLFIYPFAVLYYFGMPLVITYKFMLAFYSIVTLIITFVLAYKVLKKYPLAPYFVTILYCFGTYRLYDVYARSSFGEIFALMFIPVIVYAVYKMTILKERSFIPLGVGFGFLAMSHNITFALYCFIFGVYMLFHYAYSLYKKDQIEHLKSLTIDVMKAIVLAVLISAWFLFPMFEQFLDQEFLVNKVSFMYDLNERILPFSTVLYPFATLDNTQIHIENVINIGWPLLFMPMAYIGFKKNSYITMMTVLAYSLLLMITGVMPIHQIEQLTFIQFQFRLYILAYPLLTIVCTYIFIELLAKDKVKIANMILVIVTVYSIFNCILIQIETLNSTSQVKNSDTREILYDYKSEADHRDHNGLEISAGEYLPTTEKVHYLKETTYIKETNINGDGYLDVIYDFDRQFTRITFTYDNPDERKLIMLPQSYYKGYQAYEIIDGKEVPIETISVPQYKKVGFYVDEGLHTYTSRYVGTLVQKISLAVSVISGLALVTYIAYNYKKNKSTAKLYNKG